MDETGDCVEITTTNNPKALFQVDHGAGWQTIAEVDITNGIVQPPNAWTMVRAMRKQIVYVDDTPVKTTIAPSDNSQRDTHFAGFAKLLADELQVTGGYPLSEVKQLIARRAYDLVTHVLWQTTPASGSTIKKYKGLTIEEIARAIPDMPALPKVEE